MEVHIKKLKKKIDSRGSFMEVLRAEDTGPHPFGQISITTAKSDQTKGGHYHKYKREWYCVVKGSAKIYFEDRVTHEKKTVPVSDKRPEVVEMPVGVTHSITNIGKDELVVLVYISEPYFEQEPDTYKV